MISFLSVRMVQASKAGFRPKGRLKGAVPQADDVARSIRVHALKPYGRPAESRNHPRTAGDFTEQTMAYSPEKCVVCGKPMEMVNHYYHHHCDQRLLNRKDVNAKRDPTPPITRSFAARLSEGFRMLNSY